MWSFSPSGPPEVPGDASQRRCRTSGLNTQLSTLVRSHHEMQWSLLRCSDGNDCMSSRTLDGGGGSLKNSPPITALCTCSPWWSCLDFRAAGSSLSSGASDMSYLPGPTLSPGAWPADCIFQTASGFGLWRDRWDVGGDTLQGVRVLLCFCLASSSIVSICCMSLWALNPFSRLCLCLSVSLFPPSPFFSNPRLSCLFDLKDHHQHAAT